MGSFLRSAAPLARRKRPERQHGEAGTAPMVLWQLSLLIRPNQTQRTANRARMLGPRVLASLARDPLAHRRASRARRAVVASLSNDHSNPSSTFFSTTA